MAIRYQLILFQTGSLPSSVDTHMCVYIPPVCVWASVKQTLKAYDRRPLNTLEVIYRKSLVRASACEDAISMGQNPKHTLSEVTSHSSQPIFNTVTYLTRKNTQ